MNQTSQWYYVQNDQSVGPCNLSQLQNLIAMRHVTLETPVWREGLADWVRAGASDLAALFNSNSPQQAVAAPAVPGQNQVAGTFQQSGVRVFKRPVMLTRTVQVLLALSLLTTFAGIGLELWSMSLISTASSLTALEESLPVPYVVGALGNAGMSILILIITVVFWCIWVHRVSSNAHSLGAQGMAYSPGWAVGYYFIPILCLWKPYQAMVEVWKVSEAPADWQSRDAGAVVHLWWTFAILSSIASRVYFSTSLGAEDLSGMMASGWVGIGSSMLDIVFHISAIWMIGRICTLQLRQISSNG